MHQTDCTHVNAHTTEAVLCYYMVEVVIQSKGVVMDGKGCFAAIGVAVVIYLALIFGWSLIVTAGPIFGGLVVVGVFFAGMYLGSQR